MSRQRLHRLSIAFFVAMALLFSQLALARYVCPGQADATSMAATMAAGKPCTGMDAEQPVLCHQHAADAGQSAETAKLPDLPQTALLQVLVVVPLAKPAMPALRSPAATGEAQPPPQPLFLATLRLRV